MDPEVQTSQYSVLLDFEVDQRTLEQMRKKWRSFHSAFDFRETLFWAPITLRIGEVKLLNGVDAPLYSVAVDGLEALRILDASFPARVEVPSTSYALHFSKVGDEVKVLEEAEGLTASAPYSELLDAWESFSSGVREFIVSHFPEVSSHQDVGSWFSTE